MSLPKEPLFFEKEYNKGLDYYWNNYFSGWRGEILAGEARHRNLYLPYVPSRIAKTFPDAKLLVIVRNPVDRAYAHYFHRKFRGYENLPFEQALEADLERIERNRSLDSGAIEKDYTSNINEDGTNIYYRTYVDSGYYAEQIERYLELFPEENLLILFLDDMKKDPIGLYFKVLNFLNEKMALTADIDFSLKNRRKNQLYEQMSSYKKKYIKKYSTLSSLFETSVTRNLKVYLKTLTNFVEYKIFARGIMREKTRSWLVSHYLPHNRRLEILTGRDLSSWNLLP